MIIKTPEQLNRYLADGGDPERVSIEQDPLPTVPNQVIYSGEGRHSTTCYSHKYLVSALYYHYKGGY